MFYFRNFRHGYVVVSGVPQFQLEFWVLCVMLNILVWYFYNTVQITDASVYQIILSTRFPLVAVYYLPLQRKFGMQIAVVTHFCQSLLAFFFFKNTFSIAAIRCYKWRY